ncbi:MAG: O-antigen ligase family protein [Gammaproteobacteria bacterium]
MTSNTSANTPPPSRLGISFQLLVALYIGAVILLSYRANLTIAAKALGAILGASFLFIAMSSSKKIVIPATYKVWAIWFALATVSCLFAESSSLALYRAQTLAQVAVVGFIATNFMIWHRSTQFYVLALIGSALLSSAMVTLNPAPFTDFDGRVYGTLGNANTFGFILSATLVMSLVSAITSRAIILKLAFLAATATLFIMLLQTGSRKAMLGGVLLGGGMVCAAYLYRSSKVSKKSLVGAVMAVATIVPIGIIYLMNSNFWFRIERAMGIFDGGTTNADTSVQGRLWLSERALDIAARNPILGIGLDNFRVADGGGIGKQIGTYSHNNYLEVLVSTGAVGFLIYFYIYWILLKQLFLLRSCLRSNEYFGRYTMALVVTISIVAMDTAMVSYYDKVFWLLLPWLVAELHLLTGLQKQAMINRSTVKTDAEKEPDPAEAGMDKAASPIGYAVPGTGKLP